MEGTCSSRALARAHAWAVLAEAAPRQQCPLLTVLPRRRDLGVRNVARGQPQGILAICSPTGRGEKEKNREKQGELVR